jgi:ribosomal protein S27AE
MGLFDKLFGRKNQPSSTPTPPASPGYRVISASSEEVNQNAAQMGEMYFDCPKCGNAQRINNVGKMMLKANPASFSNMKCTKCGATFDAGPRVKFGKCPGFDYSQL